MTPANQPGLPSPASVADLEMRIDPERTLDLFTMMPKVSSQNILVVKTRNDVS